MAAGYLISLARNSGSLRKQKQWAKAETVNYHNLTNSKALTGAGSRRSDKGTALSVNNCNR